MDDDVKLPGSSFDELAKIIQGYAQLDREASLDDISKAIAIGPTIVSGNNGFLVSVGIIQGGQKKVVTPLGKKLGNALSHSLEDEVRLHLRDVVENSEFLRNLVAAVRIRKGMDDSALRAHVAYSAGQQKSPRVMTGAGTVVELMKRAGVIEELDGKYVSVLDVPSSASSASNAEVTTRVELRTGKLAIVRNNQNPGINISISIEVDCKPEDLEGLGARLRRVVDEFNSTEEVQARKSVEGSDGSSDL